MDIYLNKRIIFSRIGVDQGWEYFFHQAGRF